MSKTDVQDFDRTHKADPQSTRNAILRAAAELIPELGWGAVTTRAVAERAGVLNGLVSYHFNTKAELLRAAAIAGLENALAEPTGVLLGAATVSAGLRALAEWATGDALSGSQVALLTEMMLASRRDQQLHDFLAASLQEYRSMLAGLLERDARSVGRRSSPTARRQHQALASLIVAAIDGLVLHAMAADDFDPRPALLTLAAATEPSRPTRTRRKGAAR